METWIIRTSGEVNLVPGSEVELSNNSDQLRAYRRYPPEWENDWT